MKNFLIIAKFLYTISEKDRVMTCLIRKLMLITILMSLLLPVTLVYGEERKSTGSNIVLTPADQMILEAIDKDQ